MPRSERERPIRHEENEEADHIVDRHASQFSISPFRLPFSSLSPSLEIILAAIQARAMPGNYGRIREHPPWDFHYQRGGAEGKGRPLSCFFE